MWICWKRPDRMPSEHVFILSFMKPSTESELVKTIGSRLISAREASLKTRGEARHIYLSIIASIGTVDLGGGFTFRQALLNESGTSRWWFHPVTAKDCERDPIFDMIIAVLTIRQEVHARQIFRLKLVGAPASVCKVLGAVFYEKPAPKRWMFPEWMSLGRSLIGRFRFALTQIRIKKDLLSKYRLPASGFDAVFSGFWDWSFSYDRKQGKIIDHYFKRLPDTLQSGAGMSTGWFAWYDPKQRKKNDAADRLPLPSACAERVVLLQALCTIGDIMRSCCNFKPLIRFVSLRGKPEFDRVFVRNGINFKPLFWFPLIRGFLNASIPHCDLVALSTLRACQKYSPKIAFSFLEHFIYSRAHYAGATAACTNTKLYAIQHASYCREKTLYYLEPEIEYKGQPDGCSVPHPDFISVMGRLARDLYLECGYPEERVLLTGSTRYNHVDSTQGGRGQIPGPTIGRNINVLIVSTLNLKVELDLLNAVCKAAEGIQGIQLWFRNHPVERIERMPEYARYSGKVRLTTGTAEEDIASADLIIFSYSTMAEEAFLRGKPVWQWLPLGFNGSALSESTLIPRFGSVPMLERALKDFRDNPQFYFPSEASIKAVEERLFEPRDGRAAERITNVCLQIIEKRHSPAMHKPILSTFLIGRSV